MIKQLVITEPEQFETYDKMNIAKKTMNNYGKSHIIYWGKDLGSIDELEYISKQYNSLVEEVMKINKLYALSGMSIDELISAFICGDLIWKDNKNVKI